MDNVKIEIEDGTGEEMELDVIALGVEYIPAKHYNDLIDWLHNNYMAEHAPEQEITQ